MFTSSRTVHYRGTSILHRSVQNAASSCITALFLLQDLAPAQDEGGHGTEARRTAVQGVRTALGRLLAAPSLRCHTSFEFMLPDPANKGPGGVCEGVFENGVHFWCGSMPFESPLIKDMLALEDEVERARLKKNPKLAVADMEKKLRGLRTEIRDAAGVSVLAQRAGRFAHWLDGEWIPSRQPKGLSFLPDPRFLAEMLIDLLPGGDWSESVGTLAQKPVRLYRALLDQDSSSRLLLSGAVSDFGFHGHHDRNGLSIRCEGFSSTTSGQVSMEADCEVLVYVDPPSKLPLRIRVHVHSTAVAGLRASLFRARRGAGGKRGAGAALAGKAKAAARKDWTSRTDFDIRRYGRSKAVELDAKARAILRIEKPAGRAGK